MLDLNKWQEIFINNKSQLVLANTERTEMNVLDPYDNLLAKYYSWIFGSLAEILKKHEFTNNQMIIPAASKIAFSLESGSGF